MAQMTLKLGIEKYLMKEVPEVKDAPPPRLGYALSKADAMAELADLEPKMAADCARAEELRKVMAVNDIIAEIKGTIDTPEKLEAMRPVLAERVWKYMADSDSRECRNCHSFDSMNLAKQGTAGRLKHPEAALEGKTCINCHKGVAHKLPSSKDDL
jgi:hypothetical protein